MFYILCLTHTDYTRMCPVSWSKYDGGAESELWECLCVFRACLPAHALRTP